MAVLAEGDPILPLLKAAAAPDGFVPYDRFMELALYAPEVGYYARARQPFGREGDFYTATHVAPLLAWTIGERVLEAWAAEGRPERFSILELGGGDGTLGTELLAHLGPRLPAGAEWEYCLLERSDALRAAALERIRRTAPRGFRVLAQAQLASRGPFEGVVVANELLDAQPCRRFRHEGGVWWELGVRYTGVELVEESRPIRRALPGPALPDAAAEGAVLEVSPAAEGLMRELADHLVAGAALFLDYGAEEAYWTTRASAGTLTAHRAHRVLATPLDEAGRADLSAWVNFTRVRAAAKAAGLAELAFRRQSEALGAWGYGPILRQWLDAAPDVPERVRRQLASKNLLFGFERFYALELAPRAGAEPKVTA
jgi:SAM-dependent MidA family methyltransferase